MEIIGMLKKETFCSCCGIAKSVYEEKGHHKECIYWGDEMFRLAGKWLVEKSDANWKERYDLIVKFLLDEIFYLDNNYKIFLKEKNGEDYSAIKDKLIKHFSNLPSDMSKLFNAFSIKDIPPNEPITIDTEEKLIEHFGKPPEDKELQIYKLTEAILNQDRMGIIRVDESEDTDS